MANLTMIWWNVQRLFGPTDSPLSHSLDATSAHGWTSEVYKKKINAIASVLRHLTDGSPPALLGLAEVENSQVVRDLLAAAGWKELVEPIDESAWLAGTDVTLLYSKRVFELVKPAQSFNVHNLYATRDIFEIHLRHLNGSELVVLANHWPSRRISNSVHLRIGLSDRCRRLIEGELKFPKEELVQANGKTQLPEVAELQKRWNRNVLITGDFNDEPFNISTSEYLGATRTRAQVSKAPRLPKGKGARSVSRYLRLRPHFYNPSWSLMTKGRGPTGTTFWGGEWYLLDHTIISRGLLVGKGLRYVEGSLRIAAPKTVPSLAGGKPIAVLTRTSRPLAFDHKTCRGASDHLPLVWELDSGD